MYTQNKKYMRTNIEILLFDTPQKNNGEDVYEAFAFFEKYEHIFSRFRENSELSYLNRLKHMKVSEEFLQVLEYGKNSTHSQEDILLS